MNHRFNPSPESAREPTRCELVRATKRWQYCAAVSNCRLPTTPVSTQQESTCSYEPPFLAKAQRHSRESPDAPRRRVEPRDSSSTDLLSSNTHSSALPPNRCGERRRANAGQPSARVRSWTFQIIRRSICVRRRRCRALSMAATARGSSRSSRPIRHRSHHRWSPTQRQTLYEQLARGFRALQSR